MSRLTERIETHGVVTLLAATRQVLSGIVPPDPDAFETVERLRHVLERLANLIADAEPTLVSPELLQKALGPLAAMKSAVDRYVATANITFLTNAEANLDALIAEVGWPLAYSFKKPVGIRQYAGAYHDGLDAYLRQSYEQLEQLKEQIAAAAASIEEAKASLAAATDQGAQEVRAAATDSESRAAAIVAAAERRMAALSASVDQYNASLVSVTNTFNTQFASEQATRKAEAETALAEETKKHSAARTEAQAANEAAMAGWAAEAQVGLDALVEKGKAADRLLGAIGERALAGGFGQYADQQRKVADRQRWIAYGCGFLAVLVTAAVAVAAVNSNFEWTMLLRALVAVPLILVAGYAIQQSSHHRTSERDARRAELELAAIDPYLVSLDPAQRNQIKADLAGKMFAQPQQPSQAPALVDQLIDLLKEAVKRKG